MAQSDPLKFIVSKVGLAASAETCVLESGGWFGLRARQQVGLAVETGPFGGVERSL